MKRGAWRAGVVTGDHFRFRGWIRGAKTAGFLGLSFLNPYFLVPAAWYGVTGLIESTVGKWVAKRSGKKVDEIDRVRAAETARAEADRERPAAAAGRATERTVSDDSRGREVADEPRTHLDEDSVAGDEPVRAARVRRDHTPDGGPPIEYRITREGAGLRPAPSHDTEPAVPARATGGGLSR